MSTYSDKFDVLINYGRLCKQAHSTGSDTALTAEKAAELEAALLALFKEGDLVYSDLVRPTRTEKFDGAVNLRLVTEVKCTGFTLNHDAVYLELVVKLAETTLNFLLPV